MIYNQKRHIQLLKLSQDLDNQGTSLYKENREEYLELFNYERVYKISLSMEDFLKRKIDGEELCDRVYELRSKLTSPSKKIKAFQPDERSKNLSPFFTYVYCECDHFEEDYENDEFYNSIKNAFLDLQEALNEE